MADKPNNCKIVLLGESGVGKTCIISRYVNGTYDDKSESTNGASYASKTIEIQGKNLRFDIWDTAGQEKYRSLTKFFYKDATIAILVYDITRKQSFEELKNYWYDQLKTCGEKNVVIGIAGNKCDKFDEEEVSETEAKEFASSVDAVFGLTSAFKNSGIDELFNKVGSKFLDPNYQSDGTAPTKNNIKLDGDEKKKKKDKKCC
jgi:small GTP-binding protein